MVLHPPLTPLHPQPQGYAKRGFGGGGQKFVFRKWPDQIFPFVNLVFATMATLVWRGGEGGGGGGRLSQSSAAGTVSIMQVFFGDAALGGDAVSHSSSAQETVTLQHCPWTCAQSSFSAGSGSSTSCSFL